MILRLMDHHNDEGSILAPGDDYRERDVTTPTYPADFKLEMTSANNGDAGVHVTYGIFGKPDPALRPWPAAPDRQWQSPDIEIRNAKSDADPAFLNVPWAGQLNRVVATVRNNGNVSAPGVVVDFSVKDYTVTGGPETAIGQAVVDLPAGPGASGEAEIQWTPPAGAANGGHYCVIARIQSYDTPTSPSVHEMGEGNNEAQSNYDSFISATASPPSREVTSVALRNEFDRATTFHLRGGQTNPLYRTYFEHKWVYLGPGEERHIGVMVEYAPDAELADQNLERIKKEYVRQRNVVDVTGWAADPLHDEPHGLTLLQGATLHVRTGRAARIEEFEAKGEAARGRVVDSHGEPVEEGSVVVSYEGKDGPRYATTKIGDRGSFFVVIPERWRSAQAHFFAGERYGEASSETLHAD